MASKKPDNVQRDYISLMAFCCKHALVAGEILLRNFGKLGFEREKSEKDPVTNVDLEAQKYYAGEIVKAFPNDGLLGEESASLGDAIAGKEWEWIIDPLDGTVNYSAGLPLFCTSIAVAHEGKSVAGAIYDPILKELFCAAKGKGAWLNGEKIHPTKRPLVKSVAAISLSGKPERNELEVEILRRLYSKVRRFRSLGTTVHEVCNVGCGRLAASIHTITTPWDAAASNLIAEEAGCVVTDFEGRPWKLDNTTVVVSSDAATHKLIIAAIAESRKALESNARR